MTLYRLYFQFSRGQGSNGPDSSSSTERSSSVMLRCAQHLAADRDRPFAALRVTLCDCSNGQGQFVQIEPCRVCECSWYGRLAWPPTPGYIRVLPSAISHVFFGCTACDQFVQDGLAGFGAQYAPKTLDILAPGAVSTHDDGYAAIRHIHPFIEYATGDQFGVLPGAEALENRASFLGGSFIGNVGQAKAAADLIDNRVQFGEPNYLFMLMVWPRVSAFASFRATLVPIL